MTEPAHEDAVALAARAERLLDVWSRLSVQHVALGSACACGTGGVSLRLDDFEVDIVDYLEDAAQRSGMASVAAFFDSLREAGRPLRIGKPARTARPLVQLLEGIQQRHTAQDIAAWLLPRLERTIHGIAEQHGAQRAG